MDNALLVRSFEPSRDLSEEGECFVERDRTPSQPVGQRLPGNELHREKRDAVLFFQSIEGGDVSVIQRREKPGFPLETCELLFIIREGFREDLDGDFAAELGVPRAVDFPHAPRAKG